MLIISCLTKRHFTCTLALGKKAVLTVGPQQSVPHFNQIWERGVMNMYAWPEAGLVCIQCVQAPLINSYSQRPGTV